MLSNQQLTYSGFMKPSSMEYLIVDEASQILMDNYISILSRFGKSLKKICFCGDNKQCKFLIFIYYLLTHFYLQVPPYSHEYSRVDSSSIFEKQHLLKEQHLLNIQCKLITFIITSIFI